MNITGNVVMSDALYVGGLQLFIGGAGADAGSG